MIGPAKKASRADDENVPESACANAPLTGGRHEAWRRSHLLLRTSRRSNEAPLSAASTLRGAPAGCGIARWCPPSGLLSRENLETSNLLRLSTGRRNDEQEHTIGRGARCPRARSPGRASLALSGELHEGQGPALESGPSNVSLRALTPLLPEVRVPQRVCDVLLGRRMCDQPLRAEAPERGVAPETFLEALHLLAVILGHLDGYAARHALLGPDVHLLLRLGGPEKRVDVQKIVDGLQQILGEEVDILQETDEDAFLGIEQTPGIQGFEVIRQRLEAGVPDPPQELPLGDGTGRAFLYLVEAHHGLRPDTLYGIARHEDYLRLRGQPVDPGDLSFVQRRIGRCDLARHPPQGRLEYRSVPIVIVRLHVVFQVPEELPEGQSPRVQPQPVFGLPAPLFVGRALAEEPREGVGAIVDLPVEVVDLFSGHEDLWMHSEVAVQPGGARLLGSYADEIRGQQDPPMRSWRRRARRERDP